MDVSDKNKLITGEKNVIFEGEPTGNDGSGFKMPNAESLVGGATGVEIASENPTDAADAASARIGKRIKAGFVDIGVINAAAVGFALGAWTDSKAAMLAAVAVGSVATGKFAKDLVSNAIHNSKARAIVTEGTPVLVEQRTRLMQQQDELREASRRLNMPKKE